MTLVHLMSFTWYTNCLFVRCYSRGIGRVGGKQQISLGFGCITHGIAVHEIGHALGNLINFGNFFSAVNTKGEVYHPSIYPRLHLFIHPSLSRFTQFFRFDSQLNHPSIHKSSHLLKTKRIKSQYHGHKCNSCFSFLLQECTTSKVDLIVTSM